MAGCAGSFAAGSRCESMGSSFGAYWLPATCTEASQHVLDQVGKT